MSFFKGCSRQKECLILSVLLVFWVALRLPNISHPLSLKMDAASAGVAWFIDESWTHQPLTRWFAPVDHRTQWGELETGKLAPYLHVPPFALVPLGLWIQGFGKSEASLRSGGICASVLFAFLSYLSCRFWLGPWQGFGVITLMMICPQSLHYSRNVDPMITNVVWLPCMLLAYQVFERRKTSWSLSVFIWVSSCAMLYGHALGYIAHGLYPLGVSGYLYGQVVFYFLFLFGEQHPSTSILLIGHYYPSVFWHFGVCPVFQGKIFGLERFY